jgi:nicotinamide mononucleotide transporter
LSLLEIVAVLVSVATVALTIARALLCWPVGLLSVALYAKVFFDARLYSDMLLQGFFALMMVYGWIGWRRDQAQSGAVRVADGLSWRGWLAGLSAGALGTVLLGGVMARFTDAAVPWLDAGLTSYSLVAQYWTARQRVANWWLWIGVDLVYTGLFLWKALYLTAGLYAAFVVMAVLGLRRWQGAARAAA